MSEVRVGQRVRIIAARSETMIRHIHKTGVVTRFVGEACPFVAVDLDDGTRDCWVHPLHLMLTDCWQEPEHDFEGGLDRAERAVVRPQDFIRR